MLAVAILNNSLTIAVLAGVGYLVAYRLYGRYISRRILGLDPARRTPAHERQDGYDFVPSHPAVVFGPHFASLAGLGPIVGPAIAVVCLRQHLHRGRPRPDHVVHFATAQRPDHR